MPRLALALAVPSSPRPSELDASLSPARRIGRVATASLCTRFARTGNSAEALRVYEGLRTLLRDELGVTPSADTLDLHAQLLRAAMPNAR